MVIHCYNESGTPSARGSSVKTRTLEPPANFNPTFLPDQVQAFFATARERHKMYLRKQAGLFPFTEDRVFRDIFFCNVFRELDKTTVWIAENVRDKADTGAEALVDMAACRYINRIQSLKFVLAAGGLPNWSGKIAAEVLADVSPIVNSAYVIHTPKGLDKLHGLIKVVEWVEREAEEIMVFETLRETHARLMQVPLLGPFMAYEVISDMRWTRWLRDSPDILTWASFGPGACKGLSLLTAADFTSVTYSLHNIWAPLGMGRKLLELSRDPNNWPAEWPAWEMREVEHWLCEYSKYVGQLQGLRQGRKYNG